MLTNAVCRQEESMSPAKGTISGLLRVLLVSLFLVSVALVAAFLFPCEASAQSWRNCIQGSIGPGGGLSIGPGGGRSIGPGGGLSIGPDGGQSIGPGGGLSIAPGGGLGPDRDWSRGLDPRTLRDPHPFGSAGPIIAPDDGGGRSMPARRSRFKGW